MSILRSSTELDLETIDQNIDIIISKLDTQQTESMSKWIAVAFVAGSNPITVPLYPDDKELSDQQERAIKKLSAEHFGYIMEFNYRWVNSSKTKLGISYETMVDTKKSRTIPSRSWTVKRRL
ncbi:hypothetical protein [Methanococcoides sp. AM1]|uniref:hypothetical protein n=1 Tax=Methanococcoides sp. AM1 TaxID=1201011 RepID=UPI001083CD74|nr:hypothetical protein [Methanococcoides sp. AM1]